MGRDNSIISRLPHFYQSEELLNLLYRLVGVYGGLLDGVDDDLVRIMRSHWVNTSDNEGSKGFDTSTKGDLDKIFSLYIENLGGTSLLKQGKRGEGEEGLDDDKVYRARIKGLIEVLKNGASTREGIIKIIAANLGIAGDDQDAKEARKQINIIEYFPKLITTETFRLKLFETFTVVNPNRLPSEAEIRIKFDENFYQPFDRPGIANRSTGESAWYKGVVLPGETLTFLPGGKATLPGREVEIVGETPGLPPGESKWRIEAQVGFPAGKFNEARFNYAHFEEESLAVFGLFDESLFDHAHFPLSEEVIEVMMSFMQLTPASFKASIDWDIPGFSTDIVLTEQSLGGLRATDWPVEITNALENLKDLVFKDKSSFRKALKKELPKDVTVDDYLPEILEQAEFPDKFAKLDVNPRNQIKYIVDKVKAAGVYTEVAYRKRFVEIQGMKEDFIPQLTFTEDADVEQSYNFSSIQSPYPTGIDHDMSDTLILSGIFDYTRFDSLNTFA